MSEAAGVYVGVDCGGTNLRAAAAFGSEGREPSLSPLIAEGGFAAELVVPTGDAQERENGLGEAICALVERLLGSGPAAGMEVLGIGVGLPFTCHDGRAWLCRNVRALDPARLSAALEGRWGCPAELMNDVKCAAIGESWAGAAVGAESFIYVNAGTGLSAALYAGGRILQGAHHAAGEIGYWICDSAEPGALPEGYGPLEEEFSGVGLSGSYARLSSAGRRIPAEEIFRRARHGEGTASAVLERALARLYPAIANMCTFADPELLVFGGGLARGLEERADEIEAYLRKAVPFPPRVAWSSMGGRAGLVGAIRIAALRRE